jgi:hypothetical protein
VVVAASDEVCGEEEGDWVEKLWRNGFNYNRVSISYCRSVPCTETDISMTQAREPGLMRRSGALEEASTTFTILHRQ